MSVIRLLSWRSGRVSGFGHGQPRRARGDGRSGRASACRSQERFRQVRDIRRAGNRD